MYYQHPYFLLLYVENSSIKIHYQGQTLFIIDSGQ